MSVGDKKSATQKSEDASVSGAKPESKMMTSKEDYPDFPEKKSFPLWRLIIRFLIMVPLAILLHYVQSPEDTVLQLQEFKEKTRQYLMPMLSKVFVEEEALVTHDIDSSKTLADLDKEKVQQVTEQVTFEQAKHLVSPETGKISPEVVPAEKLKDLKAPIPTPPVFFGPAKKSLFNVGHHVVMLNDLDRGQWYKDALEREVPRICAPQKFTSLPRICNILDLGILDFLCWSVLIVLVD